MVARWQDRLAELGRIGFFVHLGGFLVCMVAMASGIRYGLLDSVPWLAERLPADATMVVGAYALTKVLSIPRIALTLALTPLVARVMGRSLVPAVAPVAARPESPEG